MRTLKNLPVAQDGNDAKFPDGQIRNESITETGTPVVRELYGDVITNIYKILRDAGVTPNELEDSEDTTYQLVDALKVFVNNLNDLQQILTVSGTNINMNINFDNLPNDYVFIGKTTETLLTSVAYTINSSGANSYPVSVPFEIPASSIVIAILNNGGTTIVGINSLSNTESSLSTVFGTPLTFNDSSQLIYFSAGSVLTDFPSVFNVENIIQVNQVSTDIKVVDCILHKNRLICFTFNSDTLKYQAFAFDATNLGNLLGEITLPDVSGVDNQPYFYCDAEFIYATNSSSLVNGSVNDYSIGKFSFDAGTLIISSVSFFDLDNSFEKTTNLFIGLTGLFYTLINGLLYSYNVNGSARALIGNFNTINGVVFGFSGKNYYSNGNLATQWNY